jgi:radical SAM superfamily enzyme YgiQ (UPF0313 family)
MRVLLVRPHAYLATSRWIQTILLLEPYAQELVAAAVQAPHDVRICDLAIEKRPLAAFRRVLREYRPDLIGFGGFSGQFRTNQELAAIAREMLPDSLTCIGGIHASSTPVDCKYPELFDIVIRGDGVSALRTTIAALDEGQPLPESKWILPTASPNFDSLAAQPPPPLHPDGINTLPRRDLVDTSKYFCICYGEAGKKMETLFPQIACVRTSVGCPSRCSFCAVHFLANGKYLQRDIEDVVDEIASLPQEYVYFVDDETFINTKRMKRMAELLIDRGIEKKYISWARSDTICRDPELFEVWKRAGLEFVYVGFESLEERNLSDYKKNATPSQNRLAREILRNLNLNIHAALMVNPDFEGEDFLTVHKAIKEMGPAEFAFTIFSPPPGTETFTSNHDGFVCDDPFLFYDGLHTILPTKLPLKRFYRYFSLLYALGFAQLPARVNRVKVPIRDVMRVLWAGVSFGWHIRRLYRDYDRRYW